MKILVMLILGLLVSYTCFAMFWYLPKPLVRKKYVLDFAPISNLKKGAFDEKFLEKILEKMKDIKIEEYKWGGKNKEQYTEYRFIDESNNTDLRIEILPKISEEEAMEEFEMEKQARKRYKILYENKKDEETKYYGTYFIQYRTDPEGGSILINSYSTFIGIQNSNICIIIVDWGGNQNKEKIQKYINMFGEAATKE